MSISTFNDGHRPQWKMGYHIVCQNMQNIHTLLTLMFHYLIGIKRAIAEMTMRFIESRNFGKLEVGKTWHKYTDEDWKLCEKVKLLNQKGEKFFDLESSEAIRQALTDIEKIITGDDMVRTSMKIGDNKL